MGFCFLRRQSMSSLHAFRHRRDFLTLHSVNRLANQLNQSLIFPNLRNWQARPKNSFPISQDTSRKTTKQAESNHLSKYQTKSTHRKAEPLSTCFQVLEPNTNINLRGGLRRRRVFSPKAFPIKDYCARRSSQQANSHLVQPPNRSPSIETQLQLKTDPKVNPRQKQLLPNHLGTRLIKPENIDQPKALSHLSAPLTFLKVQKPTQARTPTPRITETTLKSGDSESPSSYRVCDHKNLCCLLHSRPRLTPQNPNAVSNTPDPVKPLVQRFSPERLNQHSLLLGR